MFRATTLLSFVLLFRLSVAQTGSVEGRIVSQNSPVPFANVALKGTTVGTSADSVGNFKITNLIAGEYQLIISAMGFVGHVQKVKIEEGQSLRLKPIALAESIIGLDEVVVSATMSETFVSASPIKADVLTHQFLQRTGSPRTVMEAIGMVNGVTEVVSCGVCFTNSISINGMPGPYTAVMVDGTPMYGSLASVYGLNGIPASMIDRIEVTKGPAGALFGAEAVGGVINVVTKRPQVAPKLTIDIMGTTHAEFFPNLVYAPQVGRWSGLIGVDGTHIGEREDRNRDGFNDMVNLDRWSVFSKWALDRPKAKKLQLMAKYLFEDRRNGVMGFVNNNAYRQLRGNDSIYGESIYTHRAELLGTYELPTTEKIWADFALSHHDQDSYYGQVLYQAQQTSAYINALWAKVLKRHTLTTGATLRYERYNDNTVATPEVIHRFIPGLFVQDEWEAMPNRITILAGLRADHHAYHGIVPAPRLALKVKPTKWNTLRLSFGTGFRVVNLFTEDHAFVTGQRTVVIEPGLDPERSYNLSLSVDQVFNIGNSQGTASVTAFYTHFANRILPDYSHAGQIVYANLDGFGRAWGLSADVRHQFKFPLAWTVGANFQRVTLSELNEMGVMAQRPVEFAAQWGGVATLTYTLRKWNLDLAYTVNVTGPMALPMVFDLDASGQPLDKPRPTISQAFAIHNFQVSKRITKWGLRVYGGIQNIGDEFQPWSPISGQNDPNTAPGFSPHFDTAYAYGRLQGREFYLGVRWELANTKF